MTDAEREKAQYDILDNLLAGKKVSRWDCFGWRKELRAIVDTEEKYKSVKFLLEDEIDSAKESI